MKFHQFVRITVCAQVSCGACVLLLSTLKQNLNCDFLMTQTHVQGFVYL